MITLDYSRLLLKIIRAIKQVRISRCFFLLELLSEKDLFLKRLAERGGKREREREGGGGGRKLRPFKPLTLVVNIYFPSV